jgi:hypothetical protein
MAVYTSAGSGFDGIDWAYNMVDNMDKQSLAVVGEEIDCSFHYYWRNVVNWKLWHRLNPARVCFPHIRANLEHNIPILAEYLPLFGVHCSNHYLYSGEGGKALEVLEHHHLFFGMEFQQIDYAGLMAFLGYIK